MKLLPLFFFVSFLLIPFTATTSGHDAFCDPDTVQACTVEDMEGVCAEGNQTCLQGVWGVCLQTNKPETETCDGLDNNCNGFVDEDFDSDGDGYTSCDGDCDDTNAAVSPAALEDCDGIDNDCDDITDQDCECTDGQTMPCGSDVGECQPGVVTCIVTQEAGFDETSAWSTECEGEVGPSDEECDGLDNDCDAEIDEGLDCEEEVQKQKGHHHGHHGNVNVNVNDVDVTVDVAVNVDTSSCCEDCCEEDGTCDEEVAVDTDAAVAVDDTATGTDDDTTVDGADYDPGTTAKISGGPVCSLNPYAKRPPPLGLLAMSLILLIPIHLRLRKSF